MNADTSDASDSSYWVTLLTKSHTHQTTLKMYYFIRWFFQLKQVSFEDSQVDNFVPYSSPYILCYHNNKDRPEDVTLYHTQNNQTGGYDSSLSHVERARGDDSSLSSSNLVQVPAENTLNSTSDFKNLLKLRSRPRTAVVAANLSVDESDKSQIRNFSSSSDQQSINQSDCDKSSMSSLNGQLHMLRINNASHSSSKYDTKLLYLSINFRASLIRLKSFKGQTLLELGFNLLSKKRFKLLLVKIKFPCKRI